MSEDAKNLLEEYFLFYQNLPSGKKEFFRSRVDRFISSKRFIPLRMPSVTEEMEVTLAASAVTLSWGYPDLNYGMYRSMIFYPEEYYDQRYNNYIQGEVTPEGTIRVSWKDLVYGYAFPRDKKNLGINLMATAFSFQNNAEGEETGFISPAALAKWNEKAGHTFSVLQQKGSSYFTDITFWSRNQFFSKSAEHFFEDPEGYRESFPELYNALSEMLQVDPLNL